MFLISPAHGVPMELLAYPDCIPFCYMKVLIAAPSLLNPDACFVLIFKKVHTKVFFLNSKYSFEFWYGQAAKNIDNHWLWLVGMWWGVLILFDTCFLSRFKRQNYLPSKHETLLRVLIYIQIKTWKLCVTKNLLSQKNTNINLSV